MDYDGLALYQIYPRVGGREKNFFSRLQSSLKCGDNNDFMHALPEEQLDFKSIVFPFITKEIKWQSQAI